MSRLRSLPGLALTAAAALGLAVSAPACDEDSKTAPEKCKQPPLEIYDIQEAPDVTGSGGQGDTGNPCVTKVGHAVSSAGPEPSAGGTSTGGKSGRGGSVASDAGVGGN